MGSLNVAEAQPRGPGSGLSRSPRAPPGERVAHVVPIPPGRGASQSGSITLPVLKVTLLFMRGRSLALGPVRGEGNGPSWPHTSDCWSLSGAFHDDRAAETLSMERLVPRGVGPPLSVSVPTTAPEWTPYRTLCGHWPTSVNSAVRSAGGKDRLSGRSQGRAPCVRIWEGS